MFIASGRSIDQTRFDFYNMNFHYLNIIQKYPNFKTLQQKPTIFDEMIRISKPLSKDFANVRVDFYEVNVKFYVGEMTFFHFSGFRAFQPNEWDQVFGNWLDLSKIQDS